MHSGAGLGTELASGVGCWLAQSGTENQNPDFPIFSYAELKSKYVSLTALAAYILVSVYKIYLLASGQSIYWFALSNTLDYLVIGIVLFFIYKN